MSILTATDALSQAIANSSITVVRASIQTNTTQGNLEVKAITFDGKIALHKRVGSSQIVLTHIASGFIIPTRHDDYKSADSLTQLAVAILKSGVNLDFDSPRTLPNDTREIMSNIVSSSLVDLSQRYGNLSVALPCDCNDCGSEIEEDSETITTELGVVCEDCRDGYYWCETCSNYVEDEDTTVINDEVVCDSCRDDNFWQCENCDSWKSDSSDTQFEISNSNQTICETCYFNGGYFTCDCCETTYSEDYYGSEGRCNDCDTENSTDLDDPDEWCDCVERYSSKATKLGFLGNPQDELYLGVELELLVGDVTRSEFADIALDTHKTLADFAILKADGSIDGEGGGFEICTAPASLDVHSKYWQKFENSRHRELDVNDQLGLHVHISRQPLDELTIGKILVMINSANNRDFIEEIAGRTNDKYARLDASKTINDLYSDDRYQAVNLRNGATIEFRIFMSRLYYSEIMTCVEFCHAVTRYCAIASLRELSWVDLVAYAIENAATYPNFLEWVKDNVTNSWLNDSSADSEKVQIIREYI